MSEITPSTIYWITRADYISGAMFAFIFFAIASLVICAISYGIAKDDNDRELQLYFKKGTMFSLCFVLIFIMGYVFTPKTKEVAAMYVFPKVLNNQDIKGLGKELPKLVHEWIEELRPKQVEKENK